MYPGIHARLRPNEIAQIYEPSGATITWRDLDEGSNQFAHFVRSRGLNVGDDIAILMPNRPPFMEITWGAHRAGLYYTTLNANLTADEVAYVVSDAQARCLVVDSSYSELISEVAERIGGFENIVIVGDPLDGFDHFDDVVRSQPVEPIPDEAEGCELQYSSGTTGRPKGIKLTLPDSHPAFEVNAVTALLRDHYGVGIGTTYLSPAPLYHSAPLVWSMTALRLGATVVTLERFDPQVALAAIERRRVTHSQWVPTMFIRLLRLPDDVRNQYDLSSHVVAIHAAAPCPVHVKEQMIDWWGDNIVEYYSSTERIGSTMITAAEWSEHKGSVGRAVMGEAHIVDDAGRELPAGETGVVWFGNGPDFEYHNDPDKTARAYNDRGWKTTGDIGWMDSDGYLYLTDRKDFMIISGGVNIYPQEIEDVLLMHDDVLDVAVFGLPDDEYGEEVKAVVQPASTDVDVDRLVEELFTLCRNKLAKHKVPRSIDTSEALPRDPNGKLYKRRLRDEYLTARATGTS